MSAFPTLTSPNRSRPFLFGLFADVINADNPHLPKNAILDGTKPTAGQVALFEIALRKGGLLEGNEKVHHERGQCVGQIIAPLVR